MTKRNGNFNENVAKKLKIDDLWGEDPDIDDVDDCLLLATQACEEEISSAQRNNISELASYSFFKENDVLFTSTQSLELNNGFNKPSTSHFSDFAVPGNKYSSKHKVPDSKDVQELPNKIRKLEEELEAKEGEVSILRSQLKQVKSNVELEQAKKEKEWSEKLHVTVKELTSVKSELEFKNLEIANLRNKITEVSKTFNLDSTLNTSPCRRTKNESSDSLKLETIAETQYPLKNIISSEIFSPHQVECFHINIKYNLLNKFNSQQDEEIITQYKAVVKYKDFKIDCIFPYVSQLLNYNTVDLNSDLATEAVDKILCVTLYVVRNFLECLNILEKTLQNESIRQKDLIYLDRMFNTFSTDSSIFGNKEWCHKEIGIRARQTVAVVAEIIPFNAYIRSKILQCNDFACNDDYTNFMNENASLNNFLNLTLTVVAAIGKLRLSEYCVGFLCSVIRFLIKVTTTNEFSQCYTYIYQIAREIVFARPPTIVLEHFSNFLKYASLNFNFVKELCKMPQQKSLKTSKEGILYYNQDSCLLQVFAVLYEDNCINNRGNVRVSLTILQFVKHLLNSNASWMNFEENSHCDCVSNGINLSLKVVYESSNLYKVERHKRVKDIGFTNYHRSVLKFSIDLLHTISFKYFDLINKFPVDSQYKFIIKTLIDLKKGLDISDQDYETLKDLILQEEIQTVNKPMFNKLALWN